MGSCFSSKIITRQTNIKILSESSRSCGNTTQIESVLCLATVSAAQHPLDAIIGANETEIRCTVVSHSIQEPIYNSSFCLFLSCIDRIRPSLFTFCSIQVFDITRNWKQLYRSTCHGHSPIAIQLFPMTELKKFCIEDSVKFQIHITIWRPAAQLTVSTPWCNRAWELFRISKDTDCVILHASGYSIPVHSFVLKTRAHKISIDKDMIVDFRTSHYRFRTILRFLVFLYRGKFNREDEVLLSTLLQNIGVNPIEEEVCYKYSGPERWNDYMDLYELAIMFGTQDLVTYTQQYLLKASIDVHSLFYLSELANMYGDIIFQEKLLDRTKLMIQSFPSYRMESLVSYINLPFNISVPFLDFETCQNLYRFVCVFLSILFHFLI